MHAALQATTCSHAILAPPVAAGGSQQKVVVMGLPKTGTTSMAQALEKLGLKVQHGVSDVVLRVPSEQDVHAHLPAYFVRFIAAVRQCLAP